MTSIPETHSVYRLTARTSYHDLKLFTEPVPKPLPHEVLIKIKGIALNYRDFAISNSTYPFSAKDNLVPCSDGAGEVVAIGSSVSEFQVGDSVIGSFDLKHFYGPRLHRNQSQGATYDGVLREYVTLPEHSVTKISKGSDLSWVEMASLVCAGVTAWNALFGNIPMRPGQTVLFQGKISWG
jgi:NADPH:quinone reductase-like Zn-dependent oxidoreductase